MQLSYYNMLHNPTALPRAHSEKFLFHLIPYFISKAKALREESGIILCILTTYEIIIFNR